MKTAQKESTQTNVCDSVPITLYLQNQAVPGFGLSGLKDELKGIAYSGPPLSVGDTIQGPQWMSEVVDNTKHLVSFYHLY